VAEIKGSRELGGSKVERTSSRHQKSRSAESRGTSVDTWQNHKVGPARLTSGHASPGKRSQHSIDFSCLRDSWSKGMRVQPFNLQSRE
jgi:hypothetical protein